MISPEEIKQQALRYWEQVLINHINENEFSPIIINRIGQVKPNQVREQYERLHNEIEKLLRYAKNETGIGYEVELSEQNFRRTGSHELPKSVRITTLADYLHVTGKKKEWSTFLKNVDFVVANIPDLKAWVLDNTSWLLKPDISWDKIMLVCQYFMEFPRPDLYLRQLPIEVHTKFIEENASLLTSLLNFLIPEHIRNPKVKRFAEHYFLKYDEPLIRIKVLDEALRFQHNLKDISIPLSAFQSLTINCTQILITENKMNFLTLPDVTGALALWSGGGFNISYLKDIGWLATKLIYYWGDIDEHGFQILNQLRSYYPHAKSMLMDMSTYIAFEKFAEGVPAAAIGELPLLHPHETEVFAFLKSHPLKNRLEQERITQEFAVKEIEKQTLLSGENILKL